MKKLILTLLPVLMSISALNAQNMNFKNDDYASAWKEIENLEEQGLPKSAREKADAIYNKAKSENNPSQIIKSLIYISKYISQLEEEGFVKAVNQLEQEVQQATFPTQPILQSMLGELYSGYLENNIWRFRNRTTTVSFKQEDIRTWDIARLNAQSALLYRESLKDKKLKEVNISNFNAITTEGGESIDKIRPTLYDFLAHRAIDFFSDDKSYLSQPAYKFELDNEVVFKPTDAFITQKWESADTASGKLWTLKLLQELTKFHINDTDPAALINLDLKRLEFAHDNAVLDNKDALYVAALEGLQRKYTNNPAFVEISFKLAQYYLDKGHQYKRNTANIGKNHLKTALELAKTAIQRFPQAYGVKACRNIVHSITEPSLSAEVEQVNPTNKAILTKLTYKNIDSVYFKIIRVNNYVTEKQFESPQEQIAYLNTLPILKTWSIKVINEGDYNPMTTETKIDKLSLGNYFLLSSDNENFQIKNAGKVNLTHFYVSNMAYMQRNQESSKDIIVVDRTSGMPLKGVTVEFWNQKYNPKKNRSENTKEATAISDDKGFVKVNVPANNYYNLKFIFGKDTLSVGEGFSIYNYERPRNESVKMTEFFLDRAIYRPGQTVYFKGIVIEKNGKGSPRILPKTPIKVTFFDANYQKVSELSLTSNDYGTVNGSFTAPSTGLLGQMHIQSDINGSKYFRVEEYKRPKFEVKIAPLGGNFTLNQDIKVKGNAKMLAGSNLDGAKVQYRVTRTVNFPYWRSWGWFPWNTEGSQEIAHGEVTTDAKGDFTIPFQALANKTIPAKDKPVFNYEVQVDVTDITGETHSASSSVSIGYTSLNIGAEISDFMNRQKVQPIKVTAQNHNGEPLQAQINVKIELLTSPKRPFIKRYWEAPDTQIIEKTEFNRLFPYYAYGKEDEMSFWTIKRKVFEGKTMTSAPLSKEGNLVNIPAMQNWDPGAYRVTLTANDPTGEPIEYVEHFTLYEPLDKLVPLNSTLFAVTEKNTLEPNEDAVFYTGTSEESLKVLFEIERDGKIDTQNWLDVKGFQKMLFKIMEEDRGNVHYHLTYIKNNRFNQKTETIAVPFTNKMLNTEYQSFRDKLLPGQDEEWRIKITGKNKDKVAAEMVAAMYDASLDQFAKNSWALNLYPSSAPHQSFNAPTFQPTSSADLVPYTEGGVDAEDVRNFRSLNWFGFSFNEGFYGRGRVMARSAVPMAMDSAPVMKEAAMSPPPPPASTAGNANGFTLEHRKEVSQNTPSSIKDNDKKASDNNSPNSIKVRTNLNETVFFYPNLMTDNEGNIIIKFKMNEALTRWKFLSLAHTKDLKVGLSEKEIITQKDLMVFPNAPRFFREGDDIEFSAKVSNLANATIKGTAVLQLFDALTNQPIDVLLENKNFEVPFETKTGESSLVTWRLKIPTGKVQAVTYRVIARAGNFSDGEENTLPVLTNRMLVTESLPLSVRGGETKKFEFKSLKNTSSNTLSQHKLTLEFTQNPAWYAVQALPYLMEYPYECTEQVFSRFYANTLATHVANQYPKIKTVFDRWKSVDIAALQSNLSKNQELKNALLEETPWVLDAQREEVQKKNIGLLFDLNKMANEAESAIKKIKERQSENGGFSWFPGGYDNWYITQYLTEGFGHLDALGLKTLKNDASVSEMVEKSVKYCDSKAKEYYEELEKTMKRTNGKMEDDHLSSLIVHYLYTRSFFKNSDLQQDKIFNYYLGQAEKYWLKQPVYEQGLIALALKRFNKGETTDKIVKSLKERAINNDEMGMYWKSDAGYFWYQMPIETQSLMIELFNEVRDDKAVDDLKVWLLKNKQTNAWKTTKATASAVYALLKTGDNWLLEDKDISISISLADKDLDVSKIEKEAGTGYFKTTFKADDITPSMGDIKVTNPNKVVAWGAMYWQYFENLDKIKSFRETPLKMVKQLFKEENSDKGKILKPIADNASLIVGDKVKVRIEIRVDRDMEYVHMKDMRAAGFEPTNVLSSYKWQGGLGYYESTKDMATHFFFDYLPKGTYVFEYPVTVSHRGDFSNGITTIECMYAPEFSSHTEGVRVGVR